MSLHVDLSVPRCLLCRHVVLPSQKIFSVLGEAMKYRGYSLPFFFPEHGHRFTYTTVIYDGAEKKNCRLCRYPQCPSCRQSPIALLLHTDCTSFLRRHVPAVNCSLIWLFGLWFGSWIGPNVGFTDVLLPSPTTKYVVFDSLLQGMRSLSQELQVTIREYCRDSLLWRFSNILHWSSDLFNIIKTTKIRTLPLRELDGWTRDLLFAKASICTMKEKKQPAQFFRIGLDNLGICFVQFLSDYPSFYDTSFPDCPWYIVGRTSSLDSCKLVSNGYFLHLQASHCTIWNTSVPPDLANCQIFTNEALKPRWLKCITLDQHISGLSVFCTLNHTYEIYAHQHPNSSLGEIYENLRLAQNRPISWLYFPLAAPERILKIWIRWRNLFGRVHDPVLVIQTTRGRVYAFGDYVEREDENYEYCALSNGVDSQFFFDQPLPGSPILYFGAYSKHALEQLQPTTPLFNDIRVITEGLFHSSAALQGVDQVRLWKRSHLGKEHCVGLLITYTCGRQAALGQCFIGLSSIEILHPKLFSWIEMEFEDGTCGVNICFPSKYDQNGWQTTAMQGVVTWCFNDRSVFLEIDQE